MDDDVPMIGCKPLGYRAPNTLAPTCDENVPHIHP